MLVLSRKVGEEVVIGDDIHVTVVAVHGNQVRLGFRAPEHVSIFRQELLNKPDPAITARPMVVSK